MVKIEIMRTNGGNKYIEVITIKTKEDAQKIVDLINDTSLDAVAKILEK